MRFCRVIFTSTLLVLGIIVTPSESQAQADSSEPRTISTLAAATSATVFAETSNGAYGGYNVENGSYWYRDGYPYPGEIGQNQGGWGFSDSENFGSYHPNNCHSNIDPNGLCFETGDANGYHDYSNRIEVCPHYGGDWYGCYNWYGYYNYGYVYNPYRGYWGYVYYRNYGSDNGWINGSRGHVKRGGTLGQVENPNAYRAFFTSDDPSYYPSGVQHDVSILDIYEGGWTLCWSGSFNDQRAVSEIESACNGEYTIMAGSYEDPHIQRPSISNPAMTASDGLVAASWTITDRDGVELSNGVGRITDLESGKRFTCDIDMAVDLSQSENTVGCSFEDSMLQHRYALDLSFDAFTFGTITGGEMSEKLVMTDEFQVVPTRLIGKMSQDSEVCAYHAAPRKIIALRVGKQNRNVLTDSEGKACATFLLPEKANRLSITAFYDKVKSTESFIYMPTYKFSYRGGKNPKLTLQAKGFPKFTSVALNRVARSTGSQFQYQWEAAVSNKSEKFVASVPLLPETYDIYVTVNGESHSGSVLEVVSVMAGGGIRN